MESKLMNEILNNLSNLKNIFPSWINERMIFINCAITFSIVINNVDNLLQKQIRQFLVNEGYTDFQEKSEDLNYTIVFQNNGFKQKENFITEINNNLLLQDKNKLDDKSKLLSDNDKEYYLNMISELNDAKLENDHEKKIMMEESIKIYEENLQLKSKQLKESEKLIDKKDKIINKLENQILQLENQMKKNKDLFIHRKDVEVNFIEKQVFSDKLKKIIFKEEKLPLILCMLGVPQETLEENLCDYIMKN